MPLSNPNSGAFNGSNDYLQVNTSDTIANIFDDGGTWSAWLNPLSDGENNQGRIMDKSDGGQWRVQGQSSNNVEMFFFIPFSTTNGHWSTTAAVVPIGEWSHVDLTYDSEVVTRIMYVMNNFGIFDLQSFSFNNSFESQGVDSLEVIALITRVEHEFHTVFEDHVFDSFENLEQIKR